MIFLPPLPSIVQSICLKQIFSKPKQKQIKKREKQKLTDKANKIKTNPNHIQVNSLPAISFTIQSTPYNSPSPVLALHPIIPQCLVAIVSKSKYSLIQFVVRLPSMSCLLQKISKVAPISLSCFSKLCNSALVSSSLILSELSTTHITPSVCQKQLRQYDLMVFCPPMSHTFSLKFSYYKVLMLNPNVGLISFMFYPLNFLMIVVLPALSKPSTRRRIYFYFYLAFFTIDMKPIFVFEQGKRVVFSVQISIVIIQI